MSQMPGTFSRVRLCCGQALVGTLITYELSSVRKHWTAHKMPSGLHRLPRVPANGSLHFPLFFGETMGKDL